MTVGWYRSIKEQKNEECHCSFRAGLASNRGRPELEDLLELQLARTSEAWTSGGQDPWPRLQASLQVPVHQPTCL